MKKQLYYDSCRTQSPQDLTKKSRNCYYRFLKTLAARASAVVLLSLFSAGLLHAQVTSTYTSTISAHSTDGLFSPYYDIIDRTNAIDQDHSTYATLRAYPGAAVGLFGKSSYLELQFPSTVGANTPVYIVLSEDGNGLLDFLVGGTLGTVITGLTDFLVGGMPTLTVKAKSGSSEVFSTTMSPDEIGGNRIEIGEDGRAYLKIIPTSAFNRIRLEWSSFAVAGLLAGTQSINVHDVFYNTGSPIDCNDHFLTTSYDAPGISLSVLTANPDPIRNPERAIDTNQNNYSELGYSGLFSAGLFQSYKQVINFNRLSEAGDVAVIKYQVPGSLITLTLLDNITVKAFSGAAEVYEESLGALIDADVLGIISAIFGTSRPMYVTIPVTDQFDRIEVHYNQAVTAGVAASPLRLYGVYMTPSKPVVASNIVDVCADAEVEIAVVDPLSDVTYTWYDTDLAPVATGVSFTTTSPADGGSDTFFVASSRCVGSNSEYVPVVINSSNEACQPSDVSGIVNLADYTSSTVIYAVLVNEDSVITHYEIVDPSTGTYTFDDVPKGEYNVILISASTPPVVGTEVTDVESSLETGYVVTPSAQPVSVKGDGSPVNVPSFNVEFKGADLRTSVLAAPTSVSEGSTSNLTITVFNVGESASHGTTYVLISKPASGTLTLGTLPAGWTLFSSTSSNYILETTNAIPNGGLSAGVVIPAVFTASSSMAIQNIVVTIPAGFGGGERVTNNNTSSVQIMLNH